MALCLYCMDERGSEQRCPRCGFDGNDASVAAGPELSIGTRLVEGKYLVGRVLGAGGFGVTYLGYDTRLKIKLAIKEHFPRHLVGRAADGITCQPHDEKAAQEFTDGLRHFLREAQTGAKFDSHPNVVAVKDYFEENGTAYLVMGYIEGRSLADHLDGMPDRRIPFSKALNFILPILDALGKIHRSKLLHRDISPENIYLTRDGSVKLLDFGAARYILTSQTRSMTLSLKEGYAPVEQYSKQGRQGPWTDIYAVAATLYRAVTGSIPPASIERLHGDTLESPVKRGVVMPARAERAIMKALSLRPEERYGDVAAFARDLSAASAGGVSFDRLREEWRLVAAGLAALVVVLLGLKLFFSAEHPEDEPIPAEAMRLIGKDAAGNPLPQEPERVDLMKRSVKKDRMPTRAVASPKKRETKKRAAPPVATPASAATPVAAAPEPSPVPTVAGSRIESRDGRDLRKVQDKDRVEFIKAAPPRESPRDPMKEAQQAEKKGDREGALSAYDTACAGGQSIACYQAARLSGDTRRYRESRERFKKECSAGRAFACTNYATMLLRGEGGNKDAAQAALFFERACTAKQFVACATLAGMKEKGNGVPRDPAGAAALYRKACDGGDKKSCRKKK